MSQLTEDEVAIMETRDASPTHFLMKVESFSLLGQNEIHKYESGEFTAGGRKWRLIIYPNEEKTGIDNQYISVSLAISNPTSLQPANWELTAVMSIFLLNQITGNYHYSSGRTCRFQAMKSEWGISKFVSKNVTKDPSNGFLVDNNCVFGAEGFIVEKSAISECLSLKNITVPYKRDWKISKFSKLKDIWTSEQFEVEGLKWFVSPEINLYIYLRPNGEGNGDGRFLSIFMRCIGSKRVKAHFSICVKSESKNQDIHKKSGTVWFSPLSNSWGWSRFMDLATLKYPKYGLLSKDRYLLELELSVQAVA